MMAIEGFEKLINRKRDIIEINGGLGERASNMKERLLKLSFSIN